MIEEVLKQDLPFPENANTIGESSVAFLDAFAFSVAGPFRNCIEKAIERIVMSFDGWKILDGKLKVLNERSDALAGSV